MYLFNKLRIRTQEMWYVLLLIHHHHLVRIDKRQSMTKKEYSNDEMANFRVSQSMGMCYGARI